MKLIGGALVLAMAASVACQNITSRAPGDCTMWGGRHNNKRCFFPFKYYGRVYNGCTPSSRPLCATGVQRDMRYTDLGNCRYYCPKDHNPVVPEVIATRNTNKPCVFPFKWEGKWHYGCAPSREGTTKRTWCALEVKPDGTPRDKYLSGWAHCETKSKKSTKKVAAKDCKWKVEAGKTVNDDDCRSLRHLHGADLDECKKECCAMKTKYYQEQECTAIAFFSRWRGCDLFDCKYNFKPKRSAADYTTYYL